MCLHVREHIHVCPTGWMECVCMCVHLWVYKEERCEFMRSCAHVSFCLHVCISDLTCLCVVLSGTGFRVCVYEREKGKKRDKQSGDTQMSEKETDFGLWNED